MGKTIVTVFWIAGLCLAGSEGPIFINFVGAFLFLITSVLIGEMINE